MNYQTKESQIILTYAVRYSLNRSGVAPGVMCDELVKVWPNLNRAMQNIIKGDITRHIDAGYVTDIVDRSIWRCVVDVANEYELKHHIK